MMNLAHKPTIGYLLDGKFKIIYGYPGFRIFISPDGGEVRVQTIYITNIENFEDYANYAIHTPTMTKAQLLEKGVLYHPDGMPDNHFEVRYLKNIPIDLREDEVVWCPISVLIKPWYTNRYAVQKEMYYKYKKNGIKVDGKARFYRFPVKVKDQ